MKMNKKLFLLEHKNLCDKIDKDYKKIIESNSNNSTKLAEIKEFLSDYDSKRQILQKFYVEHELEKKIILSEAMKLISFHELKFLLLQTQLKKIEKSSCSK